jgi:hypothetical protein
MGQNINELKKKSNQLKKNFKQALALTPCTHSQGARLGGASLKSNA